MSDLDLSSDDDEAADLVDRYGYFIQTGLFIHSHGVHGAGVIRFAVLFKLSIAALMVATLLRESGPHVHRVVLAAVRKRLVVSTTLAREVQGVAETFRAQPEQRSLVRYAVHGVEKREQHQTDQDYRPGPARPEHGRFETASWHRIVGNDQFSCVTYTERFREPD